LLQEGSFNRSVALPIPCFQGSLRGRANTPSRGTT